MIVHWRLYTNCESEKNAKAVMNKATKKLKVKIEKSKIEPYHKGGYVCSFSNQLEIENWNEIPFLALALGQRIGRMWTISGDINSEFSAWSNESSISGIENIELGIERNA